mmetsp:Transcript_54679/g.146031  ORF Transcript_54679/g.146031 Transcript_54679/m.146031 type:complete len:217 (-) Transcript_54679:671-1321(-)
MIFKSASKRSSSCCTSLMHCSTNRQLVRPCPQEATRSIPETTTAKPGATERRRCKTPTAAEHTEAVDMKMLLKPQAKVLLPRAPVPESSWASRARSMAFAVAGRRLSRCFAKCLASDWTLSQRISSSTKAATRRFPWTWLPTPLTTAELLAAPSAEAATIRPMGCIPGMSNKGTVATAAAVPAAFPTVTHNVFLRRRLHIFFNCGSRDLLLASLNS